MKVVGPFLASRGMWSWVVAAVLMLVAALAVKDRVFLLEIRPGSPRPLTLLEAVGVFGASTVPAMAYPRLWSWEHRSARRRLHAFSASLRVCLIVLPTAIVWVCGVHRHFSPGVVDAILANTVLVAAISSLVSLSVDPRLGPAVAVAFYAGLTVLQAVFPAVGGPLSVGSVSSMGALAAGVACAASVIIDGWSLGRTVGVQRRIRQE